MATMRGREEYLVLRFSIKSTAMTGSDMTIVGFRPIHIVKMGPYVLDHSWNVIQGLDFGSWCLLPRNGIGLGPGGMRNQTQTSWRIATRGIANRNDTHMYGGSLKIDSRAMMKSDLWNLET
jgi:hypothetical protein